MAPSQDPKTKEIYEFGPFRVDPEKETVLRACESDLNIRGPGRYQADGCCQWLLARTRRQKRSMSSGPFGLIPKRRPCFEPARPSPSRRKHFRSFLCSSEKTKRSSPKTI